MNTVTHAPILRPPTPYNEFRIVSNLPEEPATDVTVLSKTGAGARVDSQMLGFSVVFNMAARSLRVNFDTVNIANKLF